MSGKGAIRCGSFVAIPEDSHAWRITCDHLPDWAETVTAPEATVSEVVMKLQAEFRESWRSSNAG